MPTTQYGVQVTPNVRKQYGFQTSVSPVLSSKKRYFVQVENKIVQRDEYPLMISPISRRKAHLIVADRVTRRTREVITTLESPQQGIIKPLTIHTHIQHPENAVRGAVVASTDGVTFESTKRVVEHSALVFAQESASIESEQSAVVKSMEKVVRDVEQSTEITSFGATQLTERIFATEELLLEPTERQTEHLTHVQGADTFLRTTIRAVEMIDLFNLQTPDSPIDASTFSYEVLDATLQEKFVHIEEAWRGTIDRPVLDAIVLEMDKLDPPYLETYEFRTYGMERPVKEHHVLQLGNEELQRDHVASGSLAKTEFFESADVLIPTEVLSFDSFVRNERLYDVAVTKTYAFDSHMNGRMVSLLSDDMLSRENKGSVAYLESSDFMDLYTHGQETHLMLRDHLHVQREVRNTVLQQIDSLESSMTHPVYMQEIDSIEKSYSNDEVMLIETEPLSRNVTRSAHVDPQLSLIRNDTAKEGVLHDLEAIDRTSNLVEGTLQQHAYLSIQPKQYDAAVLTYDGLLGAAIPVQEYRFDGMVRKNEERSVKMVDQSYVKAFNKAEFTNVVEMDEASIHVVPLETAIQRVYKPTRRAKHVHTHIARATKMDRFYQGISTTLIAFDFTARKYSDHLIHMDVLDGMARSNDKNATVIWTPEAMDRMREKDAFMIDPESVKRRDIEDAYVIDTEKVERIAVNYTTLLEYSYANKTLTSGVIVSADRMERVAIENTTVQEFDELELLIKKKKRIWLIPTRGNSWDPWSISKKTR